MALRHAVLGAGLPPFNSRDMERRCGELTAVLHDDRASTDAFVAATKAVDAAVGAEELTRDRVRTQTFTDAVAAAA